MSATQRALTPTEDDERIAREIAVEQYKPRPRCRDCADVGPICPYLKRPCDPVIWLSERIAQALAAKGARQREAAAKIVDAEAARVLACQTQEKSDMDATINLNLRLTTVLLPEIAAAIRSGRD